MQRNDAGPRAFADQISFAMRHARALPGFHQRHGRLLRFVDTHQKWLLLHLIADATAVSNGWCGQAGAASSGIVERAEALSIASRNTTIAFLSQLAAYGYVERCDCRADRRIKLVSLSGETEAILADWTQMLAGCMAGETDSACDTDASYRDVARALIASPAYCKPPLDIRLSQEMRGGWLVIGDIVGRIDPCDVGQERIRVFGFNAPDCARDHALSKSTLYRLLRSGADAGIMGSMTEARIPVFWLSGYHFRQYCRWINRLAEAVRAAAGNARLGAAPAKRFADRANPQGSVIRAPATTFS